jgi:hypothetical protein
VTTVGILLVHLAGLALSIAGVVRAGERPQVLVYAFILEYALRLGTLLAVAHALATAPGSLIARLAPAFSRLPPRDRRSQPLTYEGSNQPAGPGAYLMAVGLLAFLAFVFSNVNAAQQLELDWTTFSHDVQWGMLVALIYWLDSIITRSAVIDPAAPTATNLGYNTREITLLAVATLVAGVVVMARQALTLPASGWALLGPLFAVRFLFDVADALVVARVHLAGANRHR